MQQYRFRAMRSDWENKWVYGNLITTPEGTFILEEGDSVEYNEPEFHSVGMGCGLEDRNITDRYEAMKYGWDCAVEKCCELFPPFIPVKPKTVGMWTGLKDKEGVEIYEGDKLKGMMGEQESENRSPIVSTVTLKDGGFEVFSKSMSRCTIGRFTWVDAGYYGRKDSYNVIEDLEVVGNIHQVNPASGQSGVNHMNNIDPNEQKQQEEVVNAQESAAQDAAVEATESAEEGGVEG